MKLQELRQILTEYKQSWYVRKLFLGNHERAKKFIGYLDQFKEASNDYELTGSDVFRLLEAVPEIVDGELPFLQSIKNKLNTNNFFDIYTVLKKAQVITEQNFPHFYGLSVEGRNLLLSLFCDTKSKRIRLNSEIFEGVLKLAARITSDDRLTEQSLRFLHNRNHLTPTAFNLLLEKFKEIYFIFPILQELDTAKCLNDTCLQYINQHELLYSISSLLPLLNLAKLSIDDNLIKSICESKNTHSLIEILTLLLNANKFQLTIEHVTMLLKQEFGFFLSKNPAVQLLQENGLLDETTFNYVCNHDAYPFKKILEILSAQSLLQLNKEIFDALINDKFEHFRFYKAINYLNEANLLDPYSLRFCFKYILKQPKELIFSTDIFSILELFDQANLRMKRLTLDTVFTLSDANLKRLHDIVSQLLANQLLDENSFEQALKKIITKLPSVLKSEVNKNSRKNTSEPRSEFTLDNKNSFFIEHDSTHKYNRGGFGKVKKGYNSSSSVEPIYAIKKLSETDPVRAQNEAIREVKYHRLLGRKAFYFSRNKTTSIVSEWLPGKSVDQYEEHILLQTSIEQRLRCVRSGLSDLKVLHQNYRIHGDVKCQNFILDLMNNSMKLIDFGTSHKKGSSKSFGWTTEYCDPHSYKDQFCKDLYAMGLVTMSLFPELYSVVFDDNRKACLSVKKTQFTIAEQAVVKLVDSMMHSDIHLRCTSIGALQYCDEVIAQFNQMDKALLDTIAKSSINCTEPSVERLFRI